MMDDHSSLSGPACSMLHKSTVPCWGGGGALHGVGCNWSRNEDYRLNEIRLVVQEQIYTHVCIYIYISKNIFIYVYIYKHLHVCIYVYRYINVDM